LDWRSCALAVYVCVAKEMRWMDNHGMNCAGKAQQGKAMEKPYLERRGQSTGELGIGKAQY
jgi:hypothetical protein